MTSCDSSAKTPDARDATLDARRDASELSLRAAAWLQAYDERHRHARIAPNLCPATQQNYEQAMARLARLCAVSGETAGACASRLGSRRTFINYRSACYWTARQRLPALLACIGTDPGQTDGERTLAALGDLQQTLADVESFEGHRGSSRSLLLRRRRIAGLPADWRVILAQTLRERNRLGFLVSALSGCRPKELSQGITVGREEERDGRSLITLSIVGAKLTGHAGQPMRRLVYDVNACALAGLLDSALNETLGRGPVSAFTVRLPAGRLATAMASATAQLWPNRLPLTPYSLRYQFADDLRSSGIDLQQLAQALGHSNDKSHTFYTKRRARRRVSCGQCLRVQSISATRPVRRYTLESPELRRLGPRLDRNRNRERTR